MNGNEKFTFNGVATELDMLDFWQFQFSNIYTLQDSIAEYIVGKALGLTKAQNTDYWTLFDIPYRNKRIEVKETSYYHPWNEGGKVSMQRTFGITKANSSYENNNEENRFERQNDIYVFCLNTGDTKDASYPLNLNNWEFYIVPTSVINKHCENNKTIGLGRIRSLGYQAIQYDKIKDEIDRLIDEIK